MKKVLIGSQAARHYFEDFRDPKDTDYLIDGIAHRENAVEYHPVIGKGVRRIYEENKDIASVSHLYTLKVSHCFWNINWDKTMYDIKFFQSKETPLDCKLFKQLYADWANYHNAKKVNLKKSNEDFFTDSVERKYVHDDLHEAIAYNDRPVYEMIKKNLSQATVEYDAFLKLSNQQKIQLCREEIYVTALERFLIPNDFKFSVLTAYVRACKLLLTSMTKGWFPKFIALHWLELNKPDNHDFIGLFKDSLQRGKIRNA